jgi:hypothetical protein
VVNGLAQSVTWNEQQARGETTMAETNEAVTKGLEQTQEAVAKSHAEFARLTKGKPTPTQEENDRAALGEHIAEHEADGSDPDPNQTRQLEAVKPSGAGYQTRASTAGSHSSTHRSSHKPE